MIRDLYTLLNELKPSIDFSQTDNLVDNGILESFNIIELVGKIESHYDINIDVFDIVPENFKNANTIYTMIRRYLKNEPTKNDKDK